MVNKATNIDKTNNHLSSRLNTNKTKTYDVGNLDPGLCLYTADFHCRKTFFV